VISSARHGLYSFGRARVGLAISAFFFFATIGWSLIAPTSRLHRLAWFTVRAGDYDAFYCGGRIAGRANPYLTVPLAACERALIKPIGVLPVPLPPYDLAMLRLQTASGEQRARYQWVGMLLAALLAAAALLQPVVGMPWPVLFAAFVLGTGRDDIPLGQIVPLVLAGVAGSAFFLGRGMQRSAAACALLSLWEPHLGVPVVVSLFAFVPRTRVVLGAGVVALVAASLATVGAAESIDYLRRVLPIHALAEAPFAFQDSLTYALTMLHVREALAIHVGTASYVVMFLVGLLTARVLARRTGDLAFYVLLPPAFVLLGGTFIKQQQLIVAIPLCFLLVRLVPTPGKWRALATLFVVTFAWEPEHFTQTKYDVAILCFTLAVTAYSFPLVTPGRKAPAVAAAAVAATLLYAGVALVEHSRSAARILSTAPSPASFLSQTRGAADLASIPWGVAIRTLPQYDRLTVAFEIGKGFTWLGLIAMIAVAIGLAIEVAGRNETTATTV